MLKYLDIEPQRSTSGQLIIIGHVASNILYSKLVNFNG